MLGLIIGVLIAAIGYFLFRGLVQGAVRDGVEEALRNHHEWLHAADGLDGQPGTDTEGEMAPPERWDSSDAISAVRPSVTPGRMSALSVMLTRGARAPTASTAALTTAMTSSQSPSIEVNMASVRFGSPLARTIRTASAT